METNSLLDVYDVEKSCEYKGRNYLVRDNGAVLRLPKNGGRPSKLDNNWMFGNKDDNGYMLIGQARVHQIIATAFHGVPKDPKMIVDHIDTNRCNNRPENLRWITRLENVLNNPITRKKIIYLCGSIDAFLANPSILKDKPIEENLAWMRTVSKEEASKCLRNLTRWSNEDSQKSSKGNGLGSWIFREIKQVDSETDEYSLKDSLTYGAKQRNWKTPTEFLLCPQERNKSLELYMSNMQKGKVFSRTQYGDGGVIRAYGYNPDDSSIYVLTYKEEGAIKPWALSRITLEDGFYVHENKHSFFQEDGGLKFFTLAMGREWKGGQVFDDNC